MMGNANSMRYTGAHLCLCCPGLPYIQTVMTLASKWWQPRWQKQYSSYDSESTRKYMRVGNTVPHGYPFFPHLALFDMIQTYSLLHLCVYEF
jgi:hypothetical protein